MTIRMRFHKIKSITYQRRRDEKLTPLPVTESMAKKNNPRRLSRLIVVRKGAKSMLRDVADAEADHRRFIERVIESETVWLLHHGTDGVAYCESNDYEDEEIAVIMFWSDRAYAARTQKQSLPEFEPAEISLFDFLFKWLRGMADDGALAGANWTGDLIGLETDPEDLQEEIVEQMPPEMIARYQEALSQALADQIEDDL
jgi:hypothetical protein